MAIAHGRKDPCEKEPYKIKLVNFPKLCYFLEQENKRKQENANRERNDRTAPAGKGFTAPALFSLFTE